MHWLRLLGKTSPDSSTEKENDASPVQSIVAIIRNAETGPALLSVLATALFCGPIITFSPVIVRDVLQGDAGQFGGVMTAFGIGGLLGPLLILGTGKRVEPMTLSLLAALLFSLGVIAASATRTVWELGAVLVASGFLLTVANTSANTFLQSQASNRNRGQTASLFMLALRGGLSLGNLATRAMATLSHVQTALLIWRARPWLPGLDLFSHGSCESGLKFP